MRKELNTNNSKKLIIGISIIFCTVILIIGGTIAFFTQSDSEDTGNIVTLDKLELEYNDDFNENTEFMRQELIPASYDNVITSYTRIDTENKCLDSLGYSACSVYRFSIKNISDIAQELQMTLNPTANSYTNLKFLLYEVTDSRNNSLMKTTDLVKDSKVAIPLYESFMLKSNEERTFEIIFYIEAKEYDQTKEDAGKTFGAGIRIDSITTGTYVAKNFGTSCWNTDVNDPTILTKFNGIDANGEPKAECSGYVEYSDKETKQYYSIYIPSNVGGQPIKTIDKTLFFAADATGNLNNYTKINNIKIEEGITTIKDGVALSQTSFQGAFIGVGLDDVDLSTFTIHKSHDVNVTLPSTLESIGNYAFALTGNIIIKFNEETNNDIQLKNIGMLSFAMGNIEGIKIPSSVETIGERAFVNDKFLESLEFEVMSNGTSKLKTIGKSAFSGSDITSDKDNPLIIPYSVQTIENGAFYENYNLTKLEFAGSLTDVYNDPNDENYNLLTIGEQAFYGDGLDYSGEEELVLPARINSIGKLVFSGNPDDPILTSLQNIRYMGSRDILNTFGTSWYPSRATLKAYGE